MPLSIRACRVDNGVCPGLAPRQRAPTRLSGRRIRTAMTRKGEPHSPGKTMFLVIWWMAKNPYAAVFENRIEAEAAANVRNAILVTFHANGTQVAAVVDWFRHDDEVRPM